MYLGHLSGRLLRGLKGYILVLVRLSITIVPFAGYLFDCSIGLRFGIVKLFKTVGYTQDQKFTVVVEFVSPATKPLLLPSIWINDDFRRNEIRRFVFLFETSQISKQVVSRTWGVIGVLFTGSSY
jgi:hypothetical protein